VSGVIILAADYAMKVTKPVLLAAIAAAPLIHCVSSFAPSRSLSTSFARRNDGNELCSPLSAGPPVISNWRYSRDGTITGTVSNHPTLDDGDQITTSPVRNVESIVENSVVQTKSGSKYKLGTVAWGAVIPGVKAQKAREEEAKAKKAVLASAKKTASNAKPLSNPFFSSSSIKKEVAKPAKTPVAEVSEIKQPSAAEIRRLAKSTFSLTGTSISNPSNPKVTYLLSGKPRQSSGRAAKIWTAYTADPTNPDIPENFQDGDASKVQPITIKLSPDTERMLLENSNYDKVQSGLFSGRFVKKIEFIRTISSNDRSIDNKVSALVIECGQYDLKALLAARNGMPLKGRALRDAAAAAGQCIQAVHSSNLVWTDLKTENFVVVGNDNLSKEVDDTNGSMGLPGVKGIDLESVINKGGNPIDYSPEACPPEFAKAFMEGEGSEFVLDYSYDMWSLGMMLYELSTGKAYFGKKSPSQVTKLLCSDDFQAELGDVTDAKLKDLIGKCLELDPRKRPDITGFLLHPYFITTGIGPISF